MPNHATRTVLVAFLSLILVVTAGGPAHALSSALDGATDHADMHSHDHAAAGDVHATGADHGHELPLISTVSNIPALPDFVVLPDKAPQAIREGPVFLPERPPRPELFSDFGRDAAP